MQRQREKSLSGKVALVTGASRGIGRHTALKLAERGVNLVLAARSVEDGALPGTIGETAARVQALVGQALPVATDMAREEALQQLVRAAEEQFGGVDILINNAAVTSLDTWSSPLLDIPRADWEYQFAVNIPARLVTYFSSCENTLEYTGRLFLAERELEAMAIEV